MRTRETVTNGEPITLAAGSVSYTPNAVNQLASSTNPSRTYSYDYDGNMTGWYTPEGYAVTAAYDAENRLKSVDYNDGTAHHYDFVYGPDGLVAKQVIDNVETRFVRAGYLVIQERDASNGVVRSYVWDSVSPGGIGGLLELTQGGAHYDYLYDGKGNVAALTDANQNVVAAYRYDGFGVLKAKSGTLVQPYQFSTKRYYAALGASGYEYRFYLASLGRWLTQDPIGIAGGLNLYGFVGNSAVNRIDPFGLQPPEFPYPVIGPNIFGHIVQENVNTAEGIYNPFTFRNMVRNNGPWDYKQMQSEYQDFGNYNYGATGAATGLFTLETLLREAGRAQKQAGTSKPGWGCPKGGPPYGDDPNDQKWIIQGWMDYMSGMYGEPQEPNPLWGVWIQYWGGIYSRHK